MINFKDTYMIISAITFILSFVCMILVYKFCKNKTTKYIINVILVGCGITSFYVY